MKIKIAVISDTHYEPCGVDLPASRRGEIAAILLLRAVHRINRFIHPDLTVILGDIHDSGVAAEINFHNYSPDAEFVRRCLNAGVKLTLGSDAHNLYEIGEFAPHLALLRDCGFDGDLDEILLQPEPSAP